MNRKCLIAVTAMLAAATAAQAQSFTDNARVRSAQPQYENVQVPRQACTSQWVVEQPQAVYTQPQAATGPNLGGVIIGGVLGGVAGRQIGNGSGRDAATVVGAVAGAMAGDRIARNGGSWNGPQPVPQAVYGQPEQREVRSCQTVYDVQQRLTGWRVDYEYRGQLYTTTTRENPGQWLPVRVSVVPVAG